ncbi:hypothetical protein ABK040_002680 [Willaertia magna]
MAISSCTGGRDKVLDSYDNLAEFCFENQIAESTFKKYYSVYQLYSNFCVWNDLVIGEEISTVRFISAVVALSKSWVLDVFKAAITFFATRDNFKFIWNDLIKGVKKGAKKIYSKLDKKVRSRDPFPISAVHDWIDYMNSVVYWDFYSWYYFSLFAAVVITGLRCLCRPSELAEISFN